MDVNSFVSDNSEGSERHGRENLSCLRGYINHHEQNVFCLFLFEKEGFITCSK